MIDTEQNTELKKLLGSRFAKDVQTVLLQNQVYVNGVETYSPAYISHVLNGRYENADIEAAIYEVYGQRKTKKELLDNRRKALTTKNPMSANSQG